MTRLLALCAALLLAAPLQAQGTAADSAHWRATKLDLDSLARDKSAPGYSKRAQARIRARDSLRTVVVTPTPPPPPDTSVIVVKPPVDTTPTPVPPAPTPPPPSPTPAIFAHPFPAPANGAVLAELPRDTVDVSYPAITRRYRCTQLQACLDTAKSGDEILLAPGTTFVGNYVVRPTARASWVVVRSDVTDAQLGGPWETMTAAKASALNLATIRAGTSDPAILVTSGAHHVRFVGVRINTASPSTGAIVSLAGGSTLDQIPHHVTLDRVVVDGGSSDVRRCVRADAAYFALVSSSLLNCHSNNGDSQGTLAITTPGPLRIEGNIIQGGHMGLMLGGGDPSVQGLLPRDVVIRHNRLCRPIAWQGVWGTKNILELKIGQRVLIEGNVLCNVWPDGQTGFAFNIKSSNQDGTAPWSNTSDVTVRYNRIQCASGVFSLAAAPDGYPAVPTSRVAIYGNVADSIGTAPCQGQAQGAILWMGVADAVIRDNWIRNPNVNSAVYAIGVNQRAVLQNNVFGGEYGVRGEGGLAYTFPGWINSGNTVVPWGTTFANWPALPPDAARDAVLAAAATPALSAAPRARSQVIIKRGGKE